EDFDDDRATDLEDLFDALADVPTTHARRLKRSRAGIDRMIAAWDGLAADLNDPDVTWTDDHTALAEHTLGRRAAEVPYSQERKPVALKPAAAKAIAEWGKAIESGPAAGVGYIPIMGAPAIGVTRPTNDVRATRAG